MLALITAVLCQAIGERSALSIAAPALQPALGIDAVGMGWLFSAFAWAYVIAHVPAGALVDRIGARRAVAGGLALCAAASLLNGLVGWLGQGFTTVLLLRILIGIGQAPVGPSSGTALSAWFPTHERGLAGAIYGGASYLAMALFTPLLGWVAGAAGWPWMFAFVAVLGLGAALLWARLFELPWHHPGLGPAERAWLVAGGAIAGPATAPATTPATAPGAAPPAGPAPEPEPAPADPGRPLPPPEAPRPPGLREVLALCRHRMVLGVFAAQYLVTAITWFFISWFPSYLVQERGFGLAEAGVATALPAVCGFVGGVLSGLATDALLRRGRSLTQARKIPLYVGMSLSAFGLAAATFVGPQGNTLVIALMCVALFGKGFGTLGWTLLADIAPARLVGLTGGVFNAVGNLSGIVTPVAVGYLVAATGSFDTPLWLIAAHAALAIVCHAWVVGPLRRLEAGGPAR